VANKHCLIALSTCRSFEDNGNNQAVRDTWLKESLPSGWDYKMFVGAGPGPVPSDTVELRCPDTYEYLTYKTQEQVMWAFQHGYKYIYRCFPDTYAAVDRLLSCEFEQADYTGTFGGLVDTETCRPKVMFNRDGNELSVFASGGPGYFLSRRAMDVLRNCYVDSSFQEDCWLGQKLHGFRFLKLRDDRRFWESRAYEKTIRRYGPEVWNNVVAVHLSKKKTSSGGTAGWYDKQWMYDAHTAYADKSRTVDSPDVDIEYNVQPLNSFEAMLIDDISVHRGEPHVNVEVRGAEGLWSKVPR
jgi:hypothetical protein